MNILFVCTGNTCRSPMAEVLLKSKSTEIGVKSAGIFAGVGQPMTDHSVTVLQEINLAADHQSKPVDENLLTWSDLVLTMTDKHKETLSIQYPHHEDKFFTLKEYVLINEEQWSSLKQLYTDFEEKRIHILNGADDELSDQELEAKLRKELEADIRQIEQAESHIPNLNIIDPFGANLSVYRQTRDEIQKYINLLIKKLGGTLKE
ncbi:low molecular weight protein arginine phosphatase [Halobacillus rhizosphaerae]|uniref:low molecular weight protein arginine phosphatase n=1 Tax=Halobacillus rhizosphaerae TaxID=3064889 RepID=UPI00398BB5E4